MKSDLSNKAAFEQSFCSLFTLEIINKKLSYLYHFFNNHKLDLHDIFTSIYFVQFYLSLVKSPKVGC